MIKKSQSSAFSLIEISIVILVIGILIAGLMQASKLLTKFRILTAQTLTQSSPVSSIKDLTLWLEPTDSISFTNANGNYDVQDGDTISSWNDINLQLPYKKNLIQSNSSLQPIYKLEGINNLPSLFFDGADDYLENTLSTAIGEHYNHYTMFMIWKTNRNSTTQVIFHQRGTSCSGDYAGIFLNMRNSLVYGWGCGGGDTPTYAYVPNVAYGTIYKVDGDIVNNVMLYGDGLSTSTQQNVLNVGADAMTVGSGDGRYYFQGLVSEVIVYNRALSLEEINSVREYLMKKYNITI